MLFQLSYSLNGWINFQSLLRLEVLDEIQTQLLQGGASMG